jgi:hypothetical protein
MPDSVVLLAAIVFLGGLLFIVWADDDETIR